jgi:hypothetical protein
VSVPYSALRGPVERTYADGVSLGKDWSLAVETMRLDPGHVHLWAVVLEEFVDEVSKFRDLLSPVEQTAAQRRILTTAPERLDSVNYCEIRGLSIEKDGTRQVAGNLARSR